MDYSLMVAMWTMSRSEYNERPTSHGINEWAFETGPKEVTVVALGVIDFLQPWTLGKKVARVVKVLERNKATIPPHMYGERFRRHFAKRLMGRDKLKPVA